MISISLCMIVKNEEDVIGRCLASVQDLVDEIIVVDTGSTDRTKEIVRSYTDKVYDFTWIDDFAAARNESFSHATKDYVMWLDADDILKEADREGLRRLKETLNPAIDVVMMRYNAGFDQHGNPTLSYYRERLLRREKGFLWFGAIHEAITPAGNILYSEIAVTHSKLHPTDPDRNINIFRKLIASGEKLSARHQFYYARELYYHAEYDEAIRWFTKFLDDGEGWIENNISACLDLAQCYLQTNRTNRAMQALARSFVYDTPRAEICCALGSVFMTQNQHQQAIYWYETAASCSLPEQPGGFQSPDSYGFIPSMQLCVCYDRIGDHAKAKAYHEKAKALKPDDEKVLYNEQYFQSLVQKGVL